MSITLTVFALVLSALSPQGFMPTQDADGFSIRLCSGHANNKLTIMPDHPDYAMLAMVYGGPEPRDAPVPETENSVCSFASASGATLLTSGPVVALREEVSAPHEPVNRHHFVIRNRINIPPATGPPVLI
ncbi:hypothetical protein [Parasphingorhabdus litoris]|uniref:hypothetical protein n=1 Tax=Parasphingorhabdus litoris TaxID=394733 RepID=UPI001E31924F|nr:hypothetical protein [Parasphingorhabdus litoris]